MQLQQAAVSKCNSGKLPGL